MSIQSEAALEAGLIATLQQMDYEYVQLPRRTIFKPISRGSWRYTTVSGWRSMAVPNLRMRNLTRYSSTLKEAHALKRREEAPRPLSA